MKKKNLGLAGGPVLSGRTGSSRLRVIDTSYYITPDARWPQECLERQLQLSHCQGDAIQIPQSHNGDCLMSQ
jgi:hypothetical protein